MTDRIQSALSYIPADDRELWVSLAMAIKSEVGDDGFHAWDSWSQTASNYNAAAARSVWKSCKGRGITIGTLFHEAKANGWVDNEKHVRASPEQIAAQKRATAERQTQEGQARVAEANTAAKKAGWILNQCKLEKHAYFDAHGMPDLMGMVWRPSDNANLLCIPMRSGSTLVGLQLIDKAGQKKFLTGQKTGGAEYLIDNKGDDYWVEGYCTGLALRTCLAALRMRYRVHVTFSANNLKALATSGYVVADNDASQVGKNAAIATGLPYWISGSESEDFCDYWQRVGTFKASQALKQWLKGVKAERDYYA